MTETVRVECWQAGRLARRAKDGSNRSGGSPVRAADPARREQSRRALRDGGSREQRILVAPQLHLTEVTHPFLQRLAGALAYREEVGDEALAELRVHVARVLMEAARVEVYVLQFQRCDGPV